MNNSFKEFLISILESVSEMMTNIPMAIDEISSITVSEGMALSLQNSLTAVAITILTIFFMIELAGKAINPDWLTLPNVSYFFVKVMAFKFAIENSGIILNFIFEMTKSIFGLISLTTLDFPADIGISELIGMIEAVDSGPKGMLILVAYFVVVFVVILVIGCSVLIILTMLIGRLIEILILSAIAPIPLSTLISESNSSIAKKFLQTYFAVCLQNSVILLSLIAVSEVSVYVYGLSIFGNFKLLGLIATYICYASVVYKSGMLARNIVGI